MSGLRTGKIWWTQNGRNNGFLIGEGANKLAYLSEYINSPIGFNPQEIKNIGFPLSFDLKNCIIVEFTLKPDEPIDDILNELSLQKYFADKGYAPQILSVITTSDTPDSYGNVIVDEAYGYDSIIQALSKHLLDNDDVVPNGMEKLKGVKTIIKKLRENGKVSLTDTEFYLALMFSDFTEQQLKVLYFDQPTDDDILMGQPPNWLEEKKTLVRQNKINRRKLNGFYILMQKCDCASNGRVYKIFDYPGKKTFIVDKTIDLINVITQNNFVFLDFKGPNLCWLNGNVISLDFDPYFCIRINQTGESITVCNAYMFLLFGALEYTYNDTNNNIISALNDGFVKLGVEDNLHRICNNKELRRMLVHYLLPPITTQPNTPDEIENFILQKIIIPIKQKSSLLDASSGLLSLGKGYGGKKRIRTKKGRKSRKIIKSRKSRKM